MSDYVRNKAVFYPVSRELANDVLDNIIKDPFEIEVMDDGNNINYYLCYNLYSTYGEESGDFGRNRSLTDVEQAKYKKLFSEYLDDIDPQKFKYIDYCYYNCCECTDYYLEVDDFNKQI